MKARGANKSRVEGLDTDPSLAKRLGAGGNHAGMGNGTYTHTVLFGKGFVLRVEGPSEDVLSLEGILFKILLPQTPLKLV